MGRDFTAAFSSSWDSYVYPTILGEPAEGGGESLADKTRRNDESTAVPRWLWRELLEFPILKSAGKDALVKKGEAVNVAVDVENTGDLTA
jgi:hypothetical protein